MKKALLLAALVVILVFAFAGTAFAAYGQTFTVPAVPVGGTLVINPTFTKAPADLADTNHYFEVRVTGPNAQTAVEGVADGNWWPPVPTESGPGFIHFASNDYINWVGNTGILNPPPPSLKFNSAGTYAVEIRLVSETGVYPSPTWDQSSTYNVVVGAPVVSTPASSPWSIALLVVGALGAAAWIGRSRFAWAGRS
jgi:hypothetical protein